jgi:hypothetical protein
MDVNDYIHANLTHEIHTSERKSFRACRRRWDWIWRENYYPFMTAKPLEFGIAFHKAMETWYEPSTWKSDREFVLNLTVTAFIRSCEEQKKKALEEQDLPALEDEVEQDYQERFNLGIGMLGYYCTVVSPKIDQDWTPVKVEISFIVPIPNPETGDPYIWCSCKRCQEKINNAGGPEVLGTYSLPVTYAGRLDALFEDRRGRLWIADWKTALQLMKDEEWLELDDQVGSYVWALNKLKLPVAGFIYREQRKGFPQAPQENKQRRLGRLFSVNANQQTDYDTYLETVYTRDRGVYEAGLYNEFLEMLRNESIEFYSNHQVAKTPEQLQSIEYNIGLEALDMLEPDLRIYPSAGRFGCSFCAFRTPCIEKNSQHDYKYALDTMYERREHYYVRTQPSTESKGGE